MNETKTIRTAEVIDCFFFCFHRRILCIDLLFKHFAWYRSKVKLNSQINITKTKQSNERKKIEKYYRVKPTITHIDTLDI